MHLFQQINLKAFQTPITHNAHTLFAKHGTIKNVLHDDVQRKELQLGLIVVGHMVVL